MMRNATAAFAAAFLLALLPLSATAQNNSSETYRLLNLFGDVFERVRSDYVEEVTDTELIESAVNGMLTSLDPHSAYLNPKRYRDMRVQTKGEFGGLGIEVTMDKGFVKVVSPIDDTPAHRAGLKPGDLITHLDGKPILGLSLGEAVERMRGPVGSEIALTIRREGSDALKVAIKRAVIKIRSVRWRTEGKIGYVRLTNFSQRTGDGLREALKGIEAELGSKPKGIVLDLRNNPGGILRQAVAVSDAFLGKGEIVSTRGRRADDVQRFNAHSGDLADNIPIVVLINGGSASASEIVAGALQDHKRAILMGTRSFGKGSVQTIIPLPGHGAIQLTTARYFTPSGRSIQAKGIDPDILVEAARVVPLDGGATGGRREADLRGALRNGEAEKDDAAKGETADKPKPDNGVEDFQLARALDLLRGINLFKERN